ncbi:MAG: hypothetical protein R3Y12_08370, partial [Clostridia bacterium]
ELSPSGTLTDTSELSAFTYKLDLDLQLQEYGNGTEVYVLWDINYELHGQIPTVEQVIEGLSYDDSTNNRTGLGYIKINDNNVHTLSISGYAYTRNTYVYIVLKDGDYVSSEVTKLELTKEFLNENDITAPALNNYAYASGDQMAILFTSDNDLDTSSIPSTSEFSVSSSNGVSTILVNKVEYVKLDYGTIVKLTFSDDVDTTNHTVKYTGSSIKDTNGNVMGEYTSSNVSRDTYIDIILDSNNLNASISSLNTTGSFDIIYDDSNNIGNYRYNSLINYGGRVNMGNVVFNSTASYSNIKVTNVYDMLGNDISDTVKVTKVSSYSASVNISGATATYSNGSIKVFIPFSGNNTTRISSLHNFYLKTTSYIAGGNFAITDSGGNVYTSRGTSTVSSIEYTSTLSTSGITVTINNFNADLTTLNLTGATLSYTTMSASDATSASTPTTLLGLRTPTGQLLTFNFSGITIK